MKLGCTVAELLNRVSSHELSEWLAFSTLEPFGADAENLGHEITASTIANVNRSKNDKPYKVEDFMPKFEKNNKSTDEMIQMAEMFTAGLGGMDLRDEGNN